MVDGAQARHDFGSLNAFLGASTSHGSLKPSLDDFLAQKASVTAQDAHGSEKTSQAPKPQRKEPLGCLSKKVAFKMLKQLGCEVHQPASEGEDVPTAEPYIEVSVKEQPVLFQMLLEFGYPIQKGNDGYSAIRVTEKRQRRQGEISAELAAPRKPPLLSLPPECLNADGWVSLPRQRLRPEAEQELVKRLCEGSKRRDSKETKSASEASTSASEAPKFRSAAEQKAHLERLFRPRDKDSEVDLATLAASLASRPPRAPPFFGPPKGPEEGLRRQEPLRPPRVERKRSEEERKNEPRDGKAPCSKEVRPSPRLAQAGLLALSSRTPSPVFDSSSTSVPHSVALEDDEASVARSTEEFSPPSENSPPKHEEEESCEGILPGEPDRNQALNGASGGSDVLRSDYSEYLEKLLGPLPQPGRNDKRSKAEQQKRLGELAKPRQRPESATSDTSSSLGKEAKPRSPRSQREICSRLSAPRQQRPPPSVPASVGAWDDDEASLPDRLEAAFEDLRPDFATEVPAVRVVPSLLAQCPSRLERIDEERSFQLEREERDRDRQEKERRAARAASAQGIGTPYAAPVVPPQVMQPSAASRSRPLRRKAQRRPRSAEESRLTDEEAMEYLEDLRSEGALGIEDKALLENIDSLYNQLMSGLVTEEQAAMAQTSEETWGGSSSSFGRRGAKNSKWQEAPRGIPSAQDVAAAPTPQTGGSRMSPTRSNGDEICENEVLLANIDRLYGEMLEGRLGDPSSQPSETSSFQPKAETDSSRKSDSARSALQQLPALVEEVLWSTLLLVRGSAGRVDSEKVLLEFLPPEILAAFITPHGRDGPQKDLLPASLRQRIMVELPAVQAAVTSVSQLAKQMEFTPELARLVREARDGLLALASSADVSSQDLMSAAPFRQGSTPVAGTESTRWPLACDASETSSQGQTTRSRSKPRRTSMSYWTAESLGALEVKSSSQRPRRLVK